tara:strand:+ start:42504 stop:42713 length:210 start_codon:yes stop_codon:yes gene_type:complete
MAVHQVEQYYIYVDINSADTIKRLKISAYLTDKGYDDHEIQGNGFLVVDGFESHSEASVVEFEISELLN